MLAGAVRNEGQANCEPVGVGLLCWSVVRKGVAGHSRAQGDFWNNSTS
jgi:hypothetical protein